MNKRQRKKHDKKQFLYIKTKNNCVCGRNVFSLNNYTYCCIDHSTIFCVTCGREYNYELVNHRRLKILY